MTGGTATCISVFMTAHPHPIYPRIYTPLPYPRYRTLTIVNRSWRTTQFLPCRAVATTSLPTTRLFSSTAWFACLCRALRAYMDAICRFYGRAPTFRAARALHAPRYLPHYYFTAPHRAATPPRCQINSFHWHHTACRCCLTTMRAGKKLRLQRAFNMPPQTRLPQATTWQTWTAQLGHFLFHTPHFACPPPTHPTTYRILPARFSFCHHNLL